jgi:hypothetical protein
MTLNGDLRGRSGAMLAGPLLGAPDTKWRPLGEMNVFATLALLFAFVFGAVGVVKGYPTLSQIKQRAQRGRERPLVRLALSYLLILMVIGVLLVWAFTNQVGRLSTVGAPIVTASREPLPSAVSPPLTIVTTAPPTVGETVTMEELLVGECVEIQQTAPDPNEPGVQQVKAFPVACQERDGVFRVDQFSVTTSACGDEYLTNEQRSLFACISKFGGGAIPRFVLAEAGVNSRAVNASPADLTQYGEDSIRFSHVPSTRRSAGPRPGQPPASVAARALWSYRVSTCLASTNTWATSAARYHGQGV